jgi:hypothetical protein
VVEEGEVVFNILCECFINIASGDLDRREGGLLWILWATTSSFSSSVEGHLLNSVPVLLTVHCSHQVRKIEQPTQRVNEPLNKSKDSCS